MNKQAYVSPTIKTLVMADKLMDVIEQSLTDETPVIDDGETTLDAKSAWPSYSVWDENRD